MSSDAERVNGWLSRLDPASEQYPPIVVVEAIARLANPDRAAALRDVEALLRRVTHVHRTREDFDFDTKDEDGIVAPIDVADFAVKLVDRVLGAEQDGGAASS